MRRRWKTTVVALVLLALTSGCSALVKQESVNATAVRANYTEMYVDYTFYDVNGRNLGLGGSAIPFSKGGAGGIECFARLPGYGKTVRVAWDEEARDSNESKTSHYSRDIVVIGSRPVTGDSYNYVITRFFPGQQVEVEFVSEAKGSGRSPRLDELFHGRSVMRQWESKR